MTVSVNGVAVDVEKASNPEFAAVRELLRQRAVQLGFLPADSDDPKVIGAAIERLLVEEVGVPTPTEPECRRYYDNHRAEFRSGELVHARHILFQVTPSVNIAQVRTRAERALVELVAAPEHFEARARELSNCPSGENGGNLGQIAPGDTVPEFERVLFRLGPTGIIPELVKTRHGFHIVAVDRRIPGDDLPFEAVCDQIAVTLQSTTEEQALRQYVSILASDAKIVGARLDAATSPLVQ